MWLSKTRPVPLTSIMLEFSLNSKTSSHCLYLQWPHLASLYASTHNLDEEGKNPDPIMGQDNVFDPSEPYSAYRYYMQPSSRSEFSIEEPAYLHRPMYKDEESRSSDYTSGDSFRKGSTCRVLLCVFLIFSFIAVVVAAVTLAVLCKSYVWLLKYFLIHSKETFIVMVIW